MSAALPRGHPNDARHGRLRCALAALAALSAGGLLAGCSDDGSATAAAAEETTTTIETTVPAETTTAATTTTESTVPSTTTVPAPTAPDSSSSTEGILQRPFAATSPWNTQVSGEPVDPSSGALMRKASLRVATVEKDGRLVQRERRIKVGLTVNVKRWTVPVFSDNQPGAVERPAVCRQVDCGADAVTTLTIPPDACPDPQFDGWMTVLDTARGSPTTCGARAARGTGPSPTTS